MNPICTGWGTSWLHFWWKKEDAPSAQRKTVFNWVHWKFLPPSLFFKSYGCNVHFCGLNDLSTYTCKLWLRAILLAIRETAAAAHLSEFTSLLILAFLKCVSGGTVPFSWLLVGHPSHFSLQLFGVFELCRMTELSSSLLIIYAKQASLSSV